MRCVAFMRNVNQGQKGHPSTADIRAGFADAGCPDAVLFQSNGTIVFRSATPARVVGQAADAIAARSGQERQILWLALTTIARAIEPHREEREPRRFEFTLHRGCVIPSSPKVQRAAAEHRCAVVDAGRGWSVVRNDIEAEGHATPALEQVTGARATSRGLPTMLRLLDRFRN